METIATGARARGTAASALAAARLTPIAITRPTLPRIGRHVGAARDAHRRVKATLTSPYQNLSRWILRSVTSATMNRVWRALNADAVDDLVFIFIAVKRGSGRIPVANRAQMSIQCARRNKKHDVPCAAYMSTPSANMMRSVFSKTHVCPGPSTT